MNRLDAARAMLTLPRLVKLFPKLCDVVEFCCVVSIKIPISCTKLTDKNTPVMDDISINNKSNMRRKLVIDITKLLM